LFLLNCFLILFHDIQWCSIKKFLKYKYNRNSEATSSGKGSGSSKQFPATPFFFLPQREVLVLVVERNFASQNRITSAGYLKMVRYSSLLVYLLVCIEVAIHFSIFNCEKSVYFSLLCFNGVLSFDRKSHG
jgi:hypothetical protein